MAIIVIGITILIVGGILSYSAYNETKQEKTYENRVDDAVTLLTSINEGIKYIEEQNRQYTSTIFAKIDNGSFTEEDETKAFNQMYANIDKKIQSLRIEEFCDSIGGETLNAAEFPKYYRKVNDIEELLSELRTIGYTIGGFSSRKKEWENEPWCSMNTASYHDMLGIPEEVNKLEKLGNKLNVFRKEAYVATPKDNTDELVSMGIKYYNGEGVAQNEGKALEFLKKAAEKGHAHSMYNIGYIIEDDNPDEARKWYVKSAVAGDRQAMIILAQNYYNILNPNHQDKSTQEKTWARKWYNRAADYGNRDGLYHMGLNYYFGWYDKKDESKAVKYFQIGMLFGSAQCANGYAMLQKTPEEQAKYYRLKFLI